jgi:hypothetical protein
LSNPQWIDFSHPKNQVVAKWFDAPDQRKKQDFFHQLLLSVELYHRIHSKSHSDKYKRKLISQLDPVIAWDLAVAQRWLENMEITKTRTSSTQSTFSFDLKSKSRQRDALRLFAATLKWPNMDEIEYVLEESDMDEKPLEDRSADAMSWFSGIILPGRTLPWLIMNSLIDCDRDTGDALRYLTHMHPASGFQYRANTYWSSRSIVGKVLGAARGVKEIAGWVGPCIYTPDLKRTECVKVKQHESLDPPHTPDDIRSMAERSHPLGPPDDEYPIGDYDLPMPDTEDVTDLIRMEKLSFVPAKEQPSSSRSIPGAPLLFDVAIQFACGGESWRMGLRYDVSFISAFPCQKGPHGMYCDAASRQGRRSRTRKLTMNSPLLRLCVSRNPHRRWPRLHPRLGPPVRAPLPPNIPPLLTIQVSFPLSLEVSHSAAVVCPRASHQRACRRSARRERQRSVCTCVVRAPRAQRHCRECEGNVHGVCNTRGVCGVRVCGDIDRGRERPGE